MRGATACCLRETATGVTNAADVPSLFPISLALALNYCKALNLSLIACFPFPPEYLASEAKQPVLPTRIVELRRCRNRRLESITGRGSRSMDGKIELVHRRTAGLSERCCWCVCACQLPRSLVLVLVVVVALYSTHPCTMKWWW